MADGKVKIEVQLDGADAANSKLGELVKTMGSAGAAAKDSANALQVHSAAAGKDTKAAADNTKAVQANTQAQKENAKAALDAGKAAQTAGTSAKQYETFAGSTGKAIGSLNLANQAFARLMMGDVVGAFKMATMAAKEFFAAIVANPILLAIAAIAAAVAAAANEISKMRDRQREAAEEARKWRDIVNGIQSDTADYEKRRNSGIQTSVSEMTDSELRRAQASARETRRQKEQKVNWFERQARFQTDAYSEEEYSKAKNERSDAQSRVEEIEAELHRRHVADREAKKQERLDAEAKKERVEEGQAELDQQKRYDAIEREKGKGARLRAQFDDLYQERARETDPEKKLDLDKQLYQLTKEMTAERERQKEVEESLAQQAELRLELEKKQADAARNAQAEWERSRKLRQMDAAERVTALRAELGELKKGPRNAETEARMRRVIDELDQAKAQAKSEAEKAARDIAAAAEKADAGETQRAAKERRGGFVQFGKWGGDDEDGEGKRGGIRKSAAQRAAEARRQGFLDQQADQRKRAAGLSQWHTTTLGPRTGWRFGKQDKPEKKSPEAEATEKGNKILEEIREALK